LDEEEEEEDRGQVLPDRWEPAPPSPEPAPVARGPSPGAGAKAPATRQSTTKAARAAEAPAYASEAPARVAEAPVHAVKPTRAVEVAEGAAAAAPATPTTSAGTSKKRKWAFSSLRYGVTIRGVTCPTSGGLTIRVHVRRVAPTVPPLAPAKVLRADAFVPTRRRSLRAPRAGASPAVMVSEASRGAGEAFGSRLATSTVEPQWAAAEA
jgi:hypothetical protein